jgi:predicted aspartyl protease
MKKTIGCFLGACLLLQISPARAQQNPDSTNTNVSYEVPFELRGGFLVVFEGRIAQLQKLKFVLDTGASYSVVDQRIARKLSLPRSVGRVFSFDKYVPVELEEFPVVQFGPIEVHNVPMMVADLGTHWGFPGHADAIIGLDLLHRCKGFSIDYLARRVLFRVTTANSTAPSRTPSYFTMTVLIQGQIARLLVDTGMNGILLYEDRLRKRVPNILLKEQKNGVRFGSLHVRQARLPGVLLSTSALQPTVSLMSGPSESLLPGVDGYFGTDALNARQVEFDFENNSLAWN